MSAGYEPQLNPAAGNETNFGGAPGDWGAGISQGLEQAGASIDSAIHQVKDKQRDEEATQAGVQFAKNATDLDNAAVALRQQTGPGGAGHTDNVNAAIDQTVAPAIASIGDRKVRMAFQQRYADLKQQLGTREYGWQAGQSISHMATNYDNQGTIGADHLASTGDYDALQIHLAGLHATASSLAVNPDLQDKLYREQADKAVNAYAGAAVRLNPYALIGNPDTGQKGQLDDPSFVNNFTNPKMIDEYRHQAEVQIAHNNAVKDQALAQQKAAQATLNSTTEYEVNENNKILSPQEYQTLIDNNTRLGLVKDALVFTHLKDKSDINQASQGMPPSWWDQQIATYGQKANGKDATDFDRMHLKNLQDLSGPAKEKFNADIHQWSETTPNPAPSVDWSTEDPAKLASQGAAVAAWAQHSAAAYHVADPASIILGKEDKQTFTAALKGQPVEQLRAMHQLQSAFGSQTAAAVVENLMPGNKELKFAASLNSRGMELLQRGQVALDSKEITLGEQTGPNVADDKARYEGSLKWWMNAIPPDQRAGFLYTAPKVAAGVAAESGSRSPTGDELNSVMANAFQRLGGQLGNNGNYTGGFTTMNGDKIWLPSTMSRQEFGHRWASAGPDDWVKAAGGEPYYQGPDGKLQPLSPVHMQQLGKYHIVPVTGQGGTGIYALSDGTGQFRHKDGSPWTFDIRKLR